MKIPASLGNLINLLNDAIHHGLRDDGDYYNTLIEPVLALIKLYILQVRG